MSSGPGVRFAGCGVLYPPSKHPVVYSASRSRVGGPVFVLTVCSFVLPALLSIFFLYVMLALWSPSSIATHFAFCFTSCVVVLAFWSPFTAAHFASCFTSCD